MILMIVIFALYLINHRQFFDIHVFDIQRFFYILSLFYMPRSRLQQKSTNYGVKCKTAKNKDSTFYTIYWRQKCNYLEINIIITILYQL